MNKTYPEMSLSSLKICVLLRIRRYDQSEEPQIEEKPVELYKFIEYNNLKKELLNVCDVNPEENKVLKLRNMDGELVPLSFLLEADSNNKSFYVDIANINLAGKSKSSLLHDAYVDAVQQKLNTMESRIAQAELLLPQLEWRREAHMEETVSRLSNKVAFLNRRFDELLPQEWRSKMPQTIT